MNERSSTAAGLGSADPGNQGNHLGRLRRARQLLDEAQASLQHRQTHETNLANIFIDEAKALIEQQEAEAPGERIQGREGVHGQDQKKKKIG